MKKYDKLLIIFIVIALLFFSITIYLKIDKEEEKQELFFTGLDDENLQSYVIETLQSGINAKLPNDDYVLQEIATTYVSKEYIDEINYNKQSNVYFGYTLDELAKKYAGKKYVFEVDENNKTIVKEFEDYVDVYGKVLKNVAIGSGVILIFASASIASGGGTVGIILMTSAKTATNFAVTSAALSGVISTAITGYQTKDFDKALDKGLIDASESFKWGAIVGGITGGVTETISQVNAAKEIKSMNILERGARAEARATKKYGGREQVSYLNGQEVNLGTQGASRPDLVREINGKIEALEIKNYDLNNELARHNLYEELQRQVASRVKNLPAGSSQRIVLDVQGRNVSNKILKNVISDIKNTCESFYYDIPVDIMY